MSADQQQPEVDSREVDDAPIHVPESCTVVAHEISVHSDPDPLGKPPVVRKIISRRQIQNYLHAHNVTWC